MADEPVYEKPKDASLSDKMAQGAAGEAQSEATPLGSSATGAMAATGSEVLRRAMHEQHVRATPLRITEDEAFAHAIHMSLRAEARALDARVRRRGARPVGSSPLKQMSMAPLPASEEQASEDIPSVETKVDEEFIRGSVTLRKSPPLSVWQLTLPLRCVSAPAEPELRMHAPLPVRPTPQNRPASQQASPRPLLVTNSTEFKFPSQLALPLPPRAPAGAMRPFGSRPRPSVRVRRPSRERPMVKSCVEQEMKIAKISCLSPRRMREPFGTIHRHVSTELIDVALTSSCMLPSVASGA